ncbi:GlsB/YeaQ/YmgE family stress response membrane protein [Rhodovastum atsumiense]|uniref:GlsB/YeaQ/YmgE family stress response membrane protein n=1 Tax=Rhodovastum atsumiense TaxID=504468 RepID=A0A5M6J1E1_9PROT|nr:GlsB/YeaQ/YmgE family stress response membrane protein [Rhodovastum atsumiense]KAA5614331.1 GlsB/YeaQ/YmgE family stress response membrane protein [Rhodovastum atsumiense]CAH2604799.1 GlsB/YeaQ/YmgE family stress response membrane protein [Rhodovastum atsumiense]
MWILSAIVVGLVVGAIAKLLMPGRDPGGFIITILLGIGGSMVATWLGQRIGWYGPGQAAGWIASILGAILILAVYRLFLRRRALPLA